MMNQKLQTLVTFKNVFFLGLVLCLATTAYTVAVEKQLNFCIFRLSTLDFWSGVSPYGPDWFRHGYDYYLYSPLFNVLFAPFAFLPQPLGEFAWNLFNYALLSYAIFSFPKITKQQKAYALLFAVPILGPSFMAYQYNITVAALFILAFSLLERNRPGWAIVLILVSAMTKVYGLAELSILVFYPRLWRNLGVVLLVMVALASLPLLRLGVGLYGEFAAQWLSTLAQHKSERRWETIYDLRVISWHGMREVLTPFIQVAVFSVVSAFVLARRALWGQFNFRIGVVALIMGWCILFGNSSETHTYLISVVGFLLWYYSLSERSALLQGLYWAVLVVVALMPIDLICPLAWLDFVYHTLDLNKWLMLFVWVYMVVIVFSPRRYSSLSIKV